MAEFTILVENLGQVEVGDEVLVKGVSQIPGMAGQEIGVKRVKEKVANFGRPPKDYLDIEGVGSVQIRPKPKRGLLFEVYARPAGPAAAGAGPAGGKRRKTKKASRRRRSTRRWFY